ncbi:MAG: hypothetical protein IID14_05275 [Candidatus Marinimicrobia bacterium]|nr:hypothetical protein [Candidatus Neomarinimicrobiota bacterium]
MVSRIGMGLARLVLIMVVTMGCSHGKQPAPAGLSAEGREVVDYLFNDWKEQFRSTTIPQAMGILGMKPDDAFRLQVIDYLRANLDQARNLRFWGPNNYLLTHDEKLIAKLLLNTYRDEDRLPSRQEISKRLHILEGEIGDRLAFMAQAGFLDAAQDQASGYILAEGAGQWGGPLRHNFHTIYVEGEPVFDVW